MALVSEAGTPLLSDPGFRWWPPRWPPVYAWSRCPDRRRCWRRWSAAGLPTDRFAFLGFPPRKSGARRRLFESLRALPFTLVFYESPMRTGATLDDLAAVLGDDRAACVARELTKEHEELVRGSLRELGERYRENRPLGEVTLVVTGASEDAVDEVDDDALAARADALLQQGLSPRDAADQLAATTGHPRREVYKLVLSRRRTD